MKITEADLNRHIPVLLKTGMRLCRSEEDARRLVCSTLDAAQKKRWKKTDDIPMDAWLTLLMMQQHMAVPYGSYASLQ